MHTCPLTQSCTLLEAPEIAYAGGSSAVRNMRASREVACLPCLNGSLGMHAEATTDMSGTESCWGRLRLLEF